MEKREGQRQLYALIISLMIIGISLILGIQRDPETGAVTLNAMFLIWGIFMAFVAYIALTFRGYRERYLVRMRYCVSCGRNIPFEAVICPYCRHDYEKP